MVSGGSRPLLCSHERLTTVASVQSRPALRVGSARCSRAGPHSEGSLPTFISDTRWKHWPLSPRSPCSLARACGRRRLQPCRLPVAAPESLSACAAAVRPRNWPAPV